jgi:prepilin-type N-terminal cleavage/methylation domain-containing protein
MKNKKGLTLVELIVSIALISIVMVFMFQLLTELRYQDASDTGKVEYKVAATILTKEIQNILLEEQIDTLTSCDTTNSCLMITFVGGNTLELALVMKIKF